MVLRACGSILLCSLLQRLLLHQHHLPLGIAALLSKTRIQDQKDVHSYHCFCEFVVCPNIQSHRVGCWDSDWCECNLIIGFVSWSSPKSRWPQICFNYTLKVAVWIGMTIPMHRKQKGGRIGTQPNTSREKPTDYRNIFLMSSWSMDPMLHHHGFVI